MASTSYVAFPNLMNQLKNLNITLLAGGVGGAKLADGLAQLLPAGNLTVIVNTGDDFQHCGLTICPDLDTVMYTLSGRANPETGWGRAGESWHTLDEVAKLGGPAWFRLGDLDLATHLTRTHWLAAGRTLTQTTLELSRQLGIQHPILPMSNQPAPTLIETEQGLLPFQTYFVEQRWQPVVKKIQLPADVRASREAMFALEKSDIVILAPSNPFVSLDPILNVYPIRAMLADLPEMVIAVSPIVGGQAVKGPAAKMMSELGFIPSARAFLDYYSDLINVYVYDIQDQEMPIDIPHLCLNTLMFNQTERVRLAHQILTFITEQL